LIAVVLGYVIVGGIVMASFEAAARFGFGTTPNNRFHVYDLRKAIRPGMTRDELVQVLNRQTSTAIAHSWRDDTGLLAWAPIGFMRSCHLIVELEDNRVVHAAVRGDHGSRLPDAPPDF
jgi:hypothetical protein